MKTSSLSRLLWGLFSFVCLVLTLAIVAYLTPTQTAARELWLHPSFQQSTATCPPQSTPTPVPLCAGKPAPVLDRQPLPTTMIQAFDRAGTNRLGNAGPSLPQVEKGPTPTLVPPYAPCILLKSMASVEAYEADEYWMQFDAPDFGSSDGSKY